MQPRRTRSAAVVAVTVSRAILLGGPTALAFVAGGFFDSGRTVAGVVAWALVALAAIAYPRAPLPRTRWGWAAVGGLTLLAGWVALSSTWAPLQDSAEDDSLRLLLYVGALIAACAAWDDRRAARWIEPALAGGVVVVIGYGLSERLLPGVVQLSHSASAVGRLDQPLTYWNATGALAAMGLVLCVRMMGDATRPGALRVAAAAATPLLGSGLYLTLSRGAAGALAVGLLALVLLAPTRSQVRAIPLGLGAASITALASSVFNGYESLIGKLSEREWQGLVMLAVLVVLAVAVALLQLWLSRGAPADPDPELVGRRSRAVLITAAILLVAVPASAAVINAVAPNENDLAKARNTTAFGSDRYIYWDIALHTAVAHPLVGVGTGGFQVEWLRERTKDEGARDAHSLYIETAAELGLVGLALLALFIGGVVGSARAAYRREPTLVAGWCAALAAFAFHAGIDWDWEMPALSLVAIVLAGALVSRGGQRE